MANMIFAPCTGAVEMTRLGCTDADFLTIKIDGEKFSGDYIVQGVTLELSGNYQFLHTVNDFVYFYAFGDRVGMLTVNGIGFLKVCSGKDGTGKGSDGASIAAIYKFYNDKKTAAKGGKALDIVLAPPTGNPIQLHGFLTGIKLDVTQGEQGPVGYWTLRLEVLPKKDAA